MTTGWTVILVRHGEATGTTENAERPLTIVGRQHAEWMASWLHDCGYSVEQILHSEKLRARQTAKIFGSRIGLHAARVNQVADLRPHDDPSRMIDILETDHRSVMLVGHQPYLARLASTLLVGDPQRLRIRFRDAGVMILERGKAGWEIRVMASHLEIK